MGSVCSAIGRLLNAIISAIAKILETLVSAVFSVLVTVIELLEYMFCCRCFGDRSEDSFRSRRREKNLAASSTAATG
ncbi:hypothetical protein DFH08DRAFT_856618 [Mycena albidolilacea]|uniref:Uncharacterized protein n=1 Tax=Mycena albidolilacea TaxID=1033008 RepID=A0AAD7AA95_9AGAR|nr:hypothetical protein DFH08DRAFT_856618 [Mycena albidolilacea]